MTSLRIVGRSQDGSTLFLVDRDGEKYELANDSTLRSALGLDNAGSSVSSLQQSTQEEPRTAHLKLATLNEAPTPREIQSLVRGGVSIAEIAAQSGLSEEKIQRYADPILRERFHIAQQALATVVKRPSTTGDSSELGTLVASRLSARGVSREDLDWDSWRREDNKWTIVLTYPVTHGTQTATWVLDPIRRTLTAEDDNARWLTGDDRTPADKVSSGIAQVAAKLTPKEAPRLIPVRSDDRDEGAQKDGVKSRASVPAWDDIMFGGRKDQDE